MRIEGEGCRMTRIMPRFKKNIFISVVWPRAKRFLGSKRRSDWPWALVRPLSKTAYARQTFVSSAETGAGFLLAEPG